MSAMNGYLRRMSEKEAFKKVEAILDPKVIRLAGDDGAPMPIQSNVDGAKFAAFIDAAVADSIRELEKREDDLSKAGVTMLGNVDGNLFMSFSPAMCISVLSTYSRILHIAMGSGKKSSKNKKIPTRQDRVSHPVGFPKSRFLLQQCSFLCFPLAAFLPDRTAACKCKHCCIVHPALLPVQTR